MVSFVSVVFVGLRVVGVVVVVAAARTVVAVAVAVVTAVVVRRLASLVFHVVLWVCQVD